MTKRSLNSSSFRRYVPWLHCKDTILKIFETNIPRKGITRPQSQFPHSCVCDRFIYSHDRSAYLFCCRKYVDRSCIHGNIKFFKQIFPEKELHGLSPNFHIHVSVSDLYVYSHDRSAYSAAGKYVDRS
jgi:hypothetical protein